MMEGWKSRKRNGGMMEEWNNGEERIQETGESKR
jgi:hypothetical protein